MKSKRELLIFFAAELVVALGTAGVFALAGALDFKVWLGALFGALIAIMNFAIMWISASKASRSAAGEGDVKSGQTVMRVSYIIRYVVMFGLLILLFKLNVINLLAAIVPLAFMPPIIIASVYFMGKAVNK